MDSYAFTDFDDDVKLIIEFWIPIPELTFKSFISTMKSSTYLPNVNRWIVDCWENTFIERQLYIHWFWRCCQVNHWILNTCYGIGIQTIYISDEVTNRVTKCWQIFIWFFWRFNYQRRSCRKLCLFLHFIQFEVIIMLRISHNSFIICNALKKHWFVCSYF